MAPRNSNDTACIDLYDNTVPPFREYGLISGPPLGPIY